MITWRFLNGSSVPTPTPIRSNSPAGLGPAKGKHIVQAHGGEVWLKSDLGVGSTFFFTLPHG